jgi:hypothetical protein
VICLRWEVVEIDETAGGLVGTWWKNGFQKYQLAPVVDAPTIRRSIRRQTLPEFFHFFGWRDI